ncbi:hypothetical protein [Pectinatus sottacetonis]|uniref:hypothetical protein n=1 Tax=Pectinatus sottacetonis TaxID=1002795 RepID=UPI0018C4C0E9|nr:hypothetical protein [Pectinatus sottacetonis]
MNLASIIVAAIIIALFIVAVRYSLKSRGCPSCNHCTGTCGHCSSNISSSKPVKHINKT